MMRIVLTGGPHSGKTELLAKLRGRGVDVIEEAALRVIEDLNQKMGVDAQRAWRLANMAAFQLEVARLQAKNEDAVTGTFVVFDRGTIDCLAYCERDGLAVPSELEAICSRSRYDLCVICEIVLPFDTRLETGRMSTLEAAVEMQRRIEHAYADRGVPVERLPAEYAAVEPIEARADSLMHMVDAWASQRSG